MRQLPTNKVDRDKISLIWDDSIDLARSIDAGYSKLKMQLSLEAALVYREFGEETKAKQALQKATNAATGIKGKLLLLDAYARLSRAWLILGDRNKAEQTLAISLSLTSGFYPKPELLLELVTRLDLLDEPQFVNELGQRLATVYNIKVLSRLIGKVGLTANERLEYGLKIADRAIVRGDRDAGTIVLDKLLLMLEFEQISPEDRDRYRERVALNYLEAGRQQQAQKVVLAISSKASRDRLRSQLNCDSEI